MVELSGAAGRRVRGYSLGMRQRLALAAALLGEPRILILDEPANGLDPQGMRWLRDLLRAQAAEGRTVLVSSHVLSEVSQTADELILIRDGKLVSQTTLAEFTAAGAGRLRVRAPTSRRSPRGARRARARRSSRDGDGALLVGGLAGEQIGELALAPRDRDPRAGAARVEPGGALPRGDGRGGGGAREPAAQRVDQALDDPDDLGDDRHRAARSRRSSPASTSAWPRSSDIGDIDDVADRHRAADGADARPRGAGGHHRVPPRHRQLDLPRLAAALAGAGGEARRLRCWSAPLAGLAFVVVNGGLALSLFSGRGGHAAAERRARLASTPASSSRWRADLRLRLRGRRDRPQPGRRDHRRDRLLLRHLPAARTAAGLDRRLLPGAGDRLPARAASKAAAASASRRRPRPRRLDRRPGAIGTRWSAPRRQRVGCRPAEPGSASRCDYTFKVGEEARVVGAEAGDAGVDGACASAPRRRRSRRSARPRRACRSGPGAG